ncbi:ArnT family glycosyltransferase [Rufibacter roseus]|uniref:ArnT family glycosyltransferase n=1 Tax=Rufibacter roseus TaxID=1567108 RepID=A0ABW2DLS5_9BACT|nr:glycosyltransferase family 39 protein [Rufibacter roseus]
MPVLLRLQKLLQSPLFWFLATSAFTLLYYFAAHEGFYFGDDYSYSLYAHQLLQGTYHLDEYVFCHRFMVFVPTALFYWLWGMNIYTTTLWPLLCTLGTYLLLFLTFRRTHPSATSWALVLLGFYYFQLNTSNYLYPDNILLFFSAACLLVLYKARSPLPNKSAKIGLGLLFATLNLLAFLTKETIVYAVPFYGCVFLYHIYSRKNRWFWVTAAVSGATFLFLYFYLYAFYTGHAFQRFIDIQNAGLADTSSTFISQPFISHLPRLTYGPILFFIGSGLAIPLIFAALYFFIPAKPKLINLQHPLSFWAVATLAMLLPIWVGSVSLGYYKPMPLLPRMFHPLLPAFCVLAGLSIERIGEKRWIYALLAILFALSAYLAGGVMWTLYLPPMLFFLVAFFWPVLRKAWLALCVVALAQAVRPAYFMLKPTVSYYFEQKNIVDQHLAHPEGNYTVYMDSTMLRRHPFFYGFKVPSNYTFKGYAAFDHHLTAPTDTTFLLINNGVLEHPELMMQLREKDILPFFPTAKLLDQKGKVKLYYLPQKQQP